MDAALGMRPSLSVPYDSASFCAAVISASRAFCVSSCSASDQQPSLTRCCFRRAMGSPSGKRAASSAGRYLLGSSDVECGPARYVTHSTSVGPRFRRARSAAHFEAAYTARKSLPSTRSDAMPEPTPRAAKVVCSPPAMAWNVEIAHWLLTTFRITGALYTCANVSAVLKSDSAVAPSPIHADAILVSPLMAEAIAQPTAWMYCVARLPEIEKKPLALTEYITGSWRPLSGSRSLDSSCEIMSTSE